MSIDHYRDKIDRLISESSGEVVLNGSHDHAAVVIEKMFDRARSTVRILTRKFDPRIYCVSATVDAAKRMLGDRSRSIHILIEELDATNQYDNPYFCDLAKYDNLILKEVPEPLRGPVSVNFALMDDAGFRFEKDQLGTSAIVAFGDKMLTPRLSAIYNRVWVGSGAPLAIHALA